MPNGEYGSVVVNPLMLNSIYFWNIYIGISAEDSKLSK